VQGPALRAYREHWRTFCFSKLTGLTPSEYRHKAKDRACEATPGKAVAARQYTSSLLGGGIIALAKAASTSRSASLTR